jgi:hypothetical protein
MAMTPTNSSIPGSHYETNSGRPGGFPPPSYSPIPCNTSPVDNQTGIGTPPDGSGCNPYCSPQEFWSARGGGAQGGQ